MIIIIIISIIIIIISIMITTIVIIIMIMIMIMINNIVVFITGLLPDAGAARPEQCLIRGSYYSFTNYNFRKK